MGQNAGMEFGRERSPTSSPTPPGQLKKNRQVLEEKRIGKSGNTLRTGASLNRAQAWLPPRNYQQKPREAGGPPGGHHPRKSPSLAEGRGNETQWVPITGTTGGHRVLERTIRELAVSAKNKGGYLLLGKNRTSWPWFSEMGGGPCQGSKRGSKEADL